MKFAQRFVLLVLMLAIAGVTVSYSQMKARPSQRGHIEQTVGTTMIKITYHRPNAKGRTLFGDSKDALVKNGKVWRSGANEATLFEFTGAVVINGKMLDAGKYSFYTIPANGEWTLIFNKTWKQWGTQYDEKTDAIRVPAKPMTKDEAKESLSYTIEDVKANSAKVILSWGKMRVPFTVTNARVSDTVQ
jgi:hypothetical protein